MPVQTPDLSMPIRTAVARDAGLTRAALRGLGYRRVRHGTYLPSAADLTDPDVRIAVTRAALSPRAVLGGWAAARFHERHAVPPTDDDVAITVFDGRAPWPWGTTELEPVLVCLPRESRVRPAPDTRPFRSDMESWEVCEIDGLRVTSPLRTAFDLARLRDQPGGVIALDRLAHLNLVDLGELGDLFRERMRWTGAPSGAASVRLASSGAESPPETLTRLICLRAGLDDLRTNPSILRPDGTFAARVDLLDARTGLVIEYDGGYHASATQRRRDAARREVLESLGLIVVVITAVDLATVDNRRTLEVRLRAAQVRASSRGGGTHGWRLAD